MSFALLCHLGSSQFTHLEGLGILSMYFFLSTSAWLTEKKWNHVGLKSTSPKCWRVPLPTRLPGPFILSQDSHKS